MTSGTMQVGTLATILAAGLAGCVNTGAKPIEQGTLIDGFRSYETVEGIKRRLNSNPSTKVHRANNPHPEYSLVSIEVGGFLDQEQRGTVVLSFFNDRLMETRFYPDDLDAYLVALRPKIQIALGKRVEAGPHVEVWCYEEAGGRRYVAWVDRRLSEEHNSLIKQLS